MPLIRKLAILVLLCSALPALAQVNAGVQWDVRTGGSSTNGGGFDPTVTSPGTNESMGNTGTSISCTVQTTTTQVICVPALSSTTHGPGNIIGPMTGTGCTTGKWNEELSQSGGTGTFTQSFGTAASVCTGTIGGSLADYLNVYIASGGAQSGNEIWEQAGTWTYTSSPTAHAFDLVFNCYTTTHGDGGTGCIWTTSTNSINIFVGATSTTYSFSGFTFSSTAGTPGNALSGISYYTLYNDTFTGFTTVISNPIVLNLINSSISSSAGAALVSGNNSLSWLISNSKIQNSTGGAEAIYFNTTNPGCAFTVLGSLITGNTGIGIATDNSPACAMTLINNTIAYNTSDGFLVYLNAVTAPVTAQGNIFYGNGGYGINSHAPPGLSFNYPIFNNGYNGYGANTNGAYTSYWTAGTGDVGSIGAQPFTSYSTGDYSLNNNSPGGAQLRGTGYPGTFIGGSPVGYRDIGAVQHQATGGTTVIGNSSRVN